MHDVHTKPSTWTRTHRRSVALGLLVVAVVAGWLAAPYLLIPHFRQPLRGTPADVGVAYETVTIRVGRPSVTLAAWWMPAPRPRGVVLLMHEGASNRSFLWSQALGLARPLTDRGYSVLAPDLRGHGESESSDEDGWPLGKNLVPDVRAWIDYVEERTGTPRVGVVGFALGGQVGLYAAAEDPRIRALVADSTWADLRSSLEVSLPKLTVLPRFVVRTLAWNAEHLYGIDFRQSRAVDVAGGVGDRLMLIENEEDPQIPLRQLRWLAAAAPGAEVWVSPAPPPSHPLYEARGPWGTHTRSYELYPEEYARRVYEFLQRKAVSAE